jgi:centrosomal protein CEP104
MKIIPFTIPFSSSSDGNFPVSNLTLLSTEPIGWASSRFCIYPQEILVQFSTDITVRKIQLLSNDKKISTKVDVFVGRNWKKSSQNV